MLRYIRASGRGIDSIICRHTVNGEATSQEEHVHLLVAWLAHLVPTKVTVHDVPVLWVGFASGFRNDDRAAWYTWLIVSVIVSFVVFVTKLVKEFDDPLAGVFEAAGMAIGTIVVLCAMKFSWLCFSHGTLLCGHARK